MPIRFSCLSGLALALALSVGSAFAQQPPKIPIKVVVVTMFEVGEDSGDVPGEFQNWVMKLPFAVQMPFPQGFRPLRYNPDKGVLGLVTGIGTARSAASVMALGMDPRFDLTKAYWLVAGIAGADPADMSIGSAAWAEFVVDADLSHEIDPREMPADWKTGYLPLFKHKPFEKPLPEDTGGAVFRLDPALVEWAYQLTREVKLDDTEALQKLREKYTETPKARQPPTVIKGDQLSGMTFWHGKLLNQWANEWVKYWTEDAGNYVTTAMEDTGTATSLTWLTRAGKADVKRLLVLRTASNFDMQYPGITAAQSLSGEMKGDYSAFIPSLDAAYKVGSTVVNELVSGWDKYRDAVPGAK
jgi:purine nucleoside permease